MVTIDFVLCIIGTKITVMQQNQSSVRSFYAKCLLLVGLFHPVVESFKEDSVQNKDKWKGGRSKTGRQRLVMQDLKEYLRYYLNLFSEFRE